MRPELFMGSAFYGTRALQGELEWRFENFSLFHQAIYRELNERNRKLDEHADRYREILDGNFSEEEELIYQSRIRTAIFDQEDIIKSIKSISDESTVVGLWAIVEQFSARSYALLEANAEGISEDDVNPPYQWNKLKNKYNKYGIILEDLPCYELANECRVLNNKIKHLYYVDDELASFSNYSSHKGKRIKQLSLPMQSYMDACYNFLGHTLEKTGIVIKDLLTNQ